MPGTCRQRPNRTTPVGFFFWYFESERDPQNDPLVIWINGGPGCSSMIGMLLELGPFMVEKGGGEAGFAIVPREGAWNQESNLVFFDQPVGTGFAYANSEDQLTHNEYEVAQQFFDAFQNFLDVFPHLRKNPIYLFGESYAGHYVPAISYKFHIENQRQPADRHIPFAGFGIGNGWVDSETQSYSNIPYGYGRNLIDLETKEALERKWAKCKKEADNKGGEGYGCGLMEEVQKAGGDPNQYDISKFEKYDWLYEKGSPIDLFLNHADVKSAIHVTQREWVCCSSAVSKSMAHDRPISMLKELNVLVEQYRALIYNGDLDLSCNHIGNEMWIRRLKWSGANDWVKTPRALWKVNGKIAGYSKSHGNLYYVTVHNVGHLVPMDDPIVGYDLLKRFLNNESYDDVIPKTPEVDPYRLGASSNILGQPFPAQSDSTTATIVSVVMGLSFLLVAMVAFKAGERRAGVNAEREPLLGTK
eukprot:comp24344_c4_seq2/m.46420 comp24344_c4_seq2/g.46420  ORF comp24344_c4_seq2/g.46420 comp24344_c4_seq2/m.46420 type:complete len:473 (-) comp24344_c4_seq2:296-1714(-)